MFNHDTISYTANGLYADLFEGFILYAAVLFLSISLFIILAKYKSKPTVEKRRGLQALSVLVTVFDTLLLIIKVDVFSFLFNPYTYFIEGTFGRNEIVDPIAKTVYIITYIVIILIAIMGIVALILGFRAIANSSLTAKANENSGIRPNVFVPPVINMPAPPVKCECGKLNAPDSTFCANCGKPLFAKQESTNNSSDSQK